MMLGLPFIGFSIPRQNGKTYVVVAFCVIQVLRGKRILYTSHRQDVAIETGRCVVEALRRKKLAPAVVDWHVSKYYVDISTTTGGIFMAKTRSESTGRSQSFDILIYDEAQFLSDRQQSAIQFTQFTGVNPVTIMCGTPIEADDMQDIDSRPFWHAHLRHDFIEWSAGDYKQKISIKDTRLLKRVNPGIARASEQVLETERTTLSHLRYCQERLGCWMPTPDMGNVLGEPVLLREQVQKILTNTPFPDGRYDLSIAIDDFSEYVCVSACSNGHLEVIQFFDSVDIWRISEWCKERYRHINSVWLKKSGRADAIKELCADHKLLYRSLRVLPAPLMSARYEQFVRECQAGTIQVFDTPDVKSALLTFWAEKNKRNDTILRGGKSDWEMIVQSLALHQAHYEIKKQRPAQASEAKKAVMVF